MQTDLNGSGEYDYDYAHSGDQTDHSGFEDHSGDDNDDYNYSYSYYDDYKSAPEDEIDYIPEMLSMPLSLTAVVGQTLELPCSAKDSFEFVRMWSHREKVLFTGRDGIN